MNPRTFTIVDTETQATKEIQSTATNVAELKNDLRSAGFNVEGKTIQEALTRTEFKDDSSLLPHDVPYRGTITNDLVFRLTKTNKNIKSGADRNVIFAEIKNRGLQDAVREKFGRNMTQVSTDNLVAFLNENQPTAPCECTSDAKEPAKESPCCECMQCLKELCSILYDNDYIDDEELDRVLGKAKIEPAKGGRYGKDELNDILRGL